MIISILQERPRQEGRAGSLGKGAGQGDKERFVKAKMNVEAQALGRHNFAKGGVCENRPRRLTRIHQGPGGEAVGGGVYCFLTSSRSPSVSCQPLTTAQSFRIPGLALFGIKLVQM